MTTKTRLYGFCNNYCIFKDIEDNSSISVVKAAEEVTNSIANLFDDDDRYISEFEIQFHLVTGEIYET